MEENQTKATTWSASIVGFGLNVFAVAVVLGVLASAQAQGLHPKYTLLDMLVYGAFLEIDETAYSPAIRAQIDQYQSRYDSYRSKRGTPTGGEARMVHAAKVRYERRLVAISTSANAHALAFAYVTDLAPCYEWEGSSDCPKLEAEFAAAYQKSHPTGPFSAYLPLLEAHRWICTAEGFEREGKSAEAMESRRLYGKGLTVARQSTSLLVRTAANELGERNQCNAS
jgi:hypothetical protein